MPPFSCSRDWSRSSLTICISMMSPLWIAGDDEQGTCRLVNHPFGTQQEIGRHGELEHMRRAAIDIERELRGPLDRQLAGIRAPENPVDEAGRAVVQIGIEHAVGHEP